MRSFHWLISTSFLAGCVSFVPATHRQTSVRPEFIVRNAVSAFQQFQIPVDHVDEMRGRVSSGTFEVQKVWGADRIDSRVVCQPGAGTTAVPFEAQVLLHIELRMGTTQRTNSMNSNTTISLHATGKRRSHETQDVKCRLTEEFAQQILSAVDARGSFYSGIR
jgi:hypothetical protein